MNQHEYKMRTAKEIKPNVIDHQCEEEKARKPNQASRRKYTPNWGTRKSPFVFE